MEDPHSNPEIFITWGREKFNVGFEKEGPGSLEGTTLKELKERLKEMTGVPLNGQKLVLSGAVMKDETAILSSLGLHPSSKVLLMGSKPDQKELAQTSTGSPEEHALLTRISQSVERISEIDRCTSIYRRKAYAIFVIT
ncbi:hypothetical protein G9A89_007494 [Geosiphon pyriformis]|nr:hypothetical protein G9A89_007494 [Geosiphon pyriformis]